MSLARLLTSGKSLVGLSNPTSRYRMRSKNLLPKFGSEKNPFSAAAPASEPVPTAQPSTTNQVARYQMSPAELAAARLKETKRLPVTASVQAKAPSENAMAKVGKTFALVKQWAQRLKWVGQRLKPLGQRLTPFARLPQRKPQMRAAALLERSGPEPVQGELSLDRVKVVRNDLSDADVEIVPAKAVTKPKPKPETSTPAQPEVELIKT